MFTLLHFRGRHKSDKKCRLRRRCVKHPLYVKWGTRQLTKYRNIVIKCNAGTSWGILKGGLNNFNPCTIWLIPLHMDGGLDHILLYSILAKLAQYGFTTICRFAFSHDLESIAQRLIPLCPFQIWTSNGSSRLNLSTTPSKFWSMIYVSHMGQHMIFRPFLYLLNESWNFRKTAFSSLE